MNKSELLTKQEAARELRVCVRTIENFMRARRLAFVKLGKAVRIKRTDLESLTQRHTVKATD